MAPTFKDVTNIEIKSPTPINRHHFEGTNITVTLPNGCWWWILETAYVGDKFYSRLRWPILYIFNQYLKIRFWINMASGRTVLFALTARASKLQVEGKRCSSFENIKPITGRDINESLIIHSRARIEMALRREGLLWIFFHDLRMNRFCIIFRFRVIYRDRGFLWNILSYPLVNWDKIILSAKWIYEPFVIYHYYRSRISTL